MKQLDLVKMTKIKQLDNKLIIIFTISADHA